MLIGGDGTPLIPPPVPLGPDGPAFERAQAEAAGNASDIDAQTVTDARSQVDGEMSGQKMAEIHLGNTENEPDSPTVNEDAATASVSPAEADINAELARLFGNGKNGVYTAAEISQAAAALDARKPADQARSGLPRLGGDEATQAAFEKYIAPYCSEDEFVDTYLAGMHNPDIEFYFDSGISTISIVGFLQDPATGDNVGEVIRLIDVGNRRAAHLSLELHDNVQGADLAKRLIGNQIEIYQKIGIKHVDLSPNKVGGYAWAKYGWLPIDADAWIALRNDIEVRVYALRNGEGSYGRISYADSLDILEMLRSNDPEVVWAIADLELPTGAYDGRGKPMTLGKALLLDQSWTGTLDLGNPDQMRRFHDYVSKKPEARQ